MRRDTRILLPEGEYTNVVKGTHPWGRDCWKSKCESKSHIG